MHACSLIAAHFCMRRSSLNKIVYETVLAMMLLGLLTLTLRIQPIKSWTWIVDDEGPADFRTIQEAINKAGAGETIYVHSGVYYERIVVNKSVSLVGENPANTTIDGGGVETVIAVTADFVNIRRFTIRNSGNETCRAIPFYRGILLNEVRCCSVFGNIIEGNEFGVQLLDSCNNVISENEMKNNECAIDLWKSCNNTFSGNIISANDYGMIFYESSNHNLISRNHMTNNGDGITLFYSCENIIFENRILNSGNGISLWMSKGNMLRNNVYMEANTHACSTRFKHGFFQVQIICYSCGS